LSSNENFFFLFLFFFHTRSNLSQNQFFSKNISILSFFRLPSSNILKSTEDSTIKSSGSTITYGPYSNTAPLTAQDLYVHYESNAPILVAKSVTRELEVSHWGGNLAVEENYDLYHEGAKYVPFPFHSFPFFLPFFVLKKKRRKIKMVAYHSSRFFLTKHSRLSVIFPPTITP